MTLRVACARAAPKRGQDVPPDERDGTAAEAGPGHACAEAPVGLLRGVNKDVELLGSHLQVRARAGVVPPMLGDFGSKEALRMHLLMERGW